MDGTWKVFLCTTFIWRVVMKLSRLERQMQFLIEIDRLKTVFRQNYLADGSRRENDSEHSWHLAMNMLQ